MAVCSLETLLEDACENGFACLPENTQRAILIQLLCDIAAGGGIVGGGATVISGSPEGVTTGDPGDFAWDTTNKILYIKDTGTGTNTGWVQLN